MANRDFRKIERIMKDFSLGVGEGESGGLIKVDELPEVGEEGVLYETPDGKYYTCTNTTEEKVISDLKVGQSYKFKDKALAGDIKELSGLFDGDAIYFNENRNESLSAGGDPEYYVEYYKTIEGNEYYLDYECTSDNLPEDLIEPTLEGFTEIPSVTITQYFVECLTDLDHDLLDVAFLFVGGSHTEEVTTSTWEELGGKNKYFEFPNDRQCTLTFNASKFLDVLIKLGVDVDAEMSMYDYSTEGAIYIGCNSIFTAPTSDTYSGKDFYIALSLYEGSGNSQAGFEVITNGYAAASYCSLAFTVEPPFTIRDLINKLQEETYSLELNLTMYTNTILSPRIGVKTGSTASSTTWYDCSLEDMQSFLKAVPSND